MPWDPTTQASIDRAIAALSHPQQGLPGATPFQETAAARATRLWKQAGPQWEMENDPQMRHAFLGSNLEGRPATWQHAQRMDYSPLNKLYQAREMATPPTPKRKKGL